MKTALFFLGLIISCLPAQRVSAQIMLSGTVYDSTKLYVVPGVLVLSSAGDTTVTDSTGSYHLPVTVHDSIRFFYRDKYTMTFPVDKIADYTGFDISLRVRVKEKYKLLKSITVFTDQYKLDSLENRVTYREIFAGRRPGISSTYEEGGPAGLDINNLIGALQFKKNRSNLAFQQRLLQEEEDRFVDNRFSSRTITRITGLQGDTLEMYKKLYRPSYERVARSSLAEFYQYILTTSYIFKRENGIDQ